jgi:hypothetical protein
LKLAKLNRGGVLPISFDACITPPNPCAKTHDELAAGALEIEMFETLNRSAQAPAAG